MYEDNGLLQVKEVTDRSSALFLYNKLDLLHSRGQSGGPLFIKIGESYSFSGIIVGADKNKDGISTMVNKDLFFEYILPKLKAFEEKYEEKTYPKT